MQIPGVSLTLTWPCRLCLLTVCAQCHCYKLSPFEAQWGGDTAYTFSGLCFYLQFTWEVGLPPSPVEFSSHHHFYKLSCSWLLGMCSCSCRPACLFIVHVGCGSSPLSCGVFFPLPLSQAFPLLVAGHTPLLPPSLARPSLFIYNSGRDSPPLSFALRLPHPLAICLIVLIAYYSVSLFPPGEGSVGPGGYTDLAQGCLWKYRVPVSSPCGPHFLSHLGAGDWQQPGGPTDFSVQCEVEMLCAGWRCGGVNVLPLLSGLACKVCLQHLSKISL
jgi:hypothetical protein